MKVKWENSEYIAIAYRNIFSYIFSLLMTYHNSLVLIGRCGPVLVKLLSTSILVSARSSQGRAMTDNGVIV